MTWFGLIVNAPYQIQHCFLTDWHIATETWWSFHSVSSLGVYFLSLVRHLLLIRQIINCLLRNAKGKKHSVSGQMRDVCTFFCLVCVCVSFFFWFRVHCIFTKRKMGYERRERRRFCVLFSRNDIIRIITTLKRLFLLHNLWWRDDVTSVSFISHFESATISDSVTNLGVRTNY